MSNESISNPHVTFGVDLWKLEKVAKEFFPTASTSFGDAAGKCEEVRSSLDDALRRPMHFGHSDLGPVHDAYVALHDVAVKFLKDTKNNLDDTATSLDQAAQAYAETDAEARKTFQQRMHDDPPNMKK